MMAWPAGPVKSGLALTGRPGRSSAALDVSPRAGYMRAMHAAVVAFPGSSADAEMIRALRDIPAGTLFDAMVRASARS